MHLIAWQNMISPHQAPLLNCLAAHAGVERLTLIVEQDISAQRANMGWAIPQLKGVDILVAPSEAELDRRLPDWHEAYHVVSGFCQGRFGKWIRNNVNQFYLYTELAKSDSHWRYIVNAIRYRWYYKRIESQVKGIFAIGVQCPLWLAKTVKVEPQKILPFGYFLKASDEKKNQKKPPKGALFIGRLEPVKGIKVLLEQYCRAQASWPLTIIGDGSQCAQIQALAKSCENVQLLGGMQQAQILPLLEEYALLLLPNQQEEGWGFVVNEALMQGTAVFCTDLTGARRAVSNAPYGRVFDHTALESMNQAVADFLDIGYSQQMRSQVKKWYNRHLSVDVAVEYMLSVMQEHRQAPSKEEQYGWW